MDKILAIDDKMDNLVTLSALLRQLMPGCTIITALSGREGIEKAKSELPDVILLDVKMPDMDGYETCRLLKAEDMTRRIPVIMITAIKTDSRSRIEGLEIGADAFLAKPIDEQELVSQLKVALRIKKAEDSLREERDSLENTIHERTAALRESERKYRDLFDNAVVGIYRSRIDGSAILEVNKALCDIFECSREDMLSEPATIRWANPKARREMIAQLNQVGTVKNYEVDFVTKSGAIRNCLVSVKLYPRKGYMEGTTIDITDRKRAEDGLKAANVKLAALQDISSLSDANIKIVSDHVLESIVRMTQSDYGFYGFIDENESVMTIHSWSGEAMKICSMVEKPLHFPIGEAGVWAEGIRRRKPFILNNYSDSHQAKKGLPPGHVPMKNLMVVPQFTHGRITSVAAVANRYTLYNEEDVSQISAFLNGIQAIVDSKRAEEKLRESEEKYRTVADYTYDWEYWIGPDGKFIYVSPSCKRISGYGVEDFLQDPKLLENISHRDDKHLLTSHLHDCLHGNSEACDLQFRIITRHNKEVWINHVCQDVYSLTGEYLGRRSSNRDITEHKRAEEEKRSLEERLARAEKMEALGTLAGGVAHDLNNILGVVVGYAEMILDDVDKASPLRHGLENIMNGGQKAAAIVDDLLTMARRGVPGRQVLNLNKIIAVCQQSPEWEHLSFHHPSVKIRIDLEPDLLNISGSSVHLGKTLYNLLANASEAMAKGGIVSISTTNQYLDKPIHGYDQIREGDYVVLSVSDTGEGIHTVDLKRIFEPFYTKKVMGRSGTGLGLAVVWGTVKDHHGYINVKSEKGKGSTFSLYFPVTREEVLAEDITVPVSVYMGKGEAVLIVDDIKEQRDLATGMLRNLNYNVVSVASGEEAVAYLKEREVDIMVLDMVMDPGMDGLDTYRSALAIHPQQKAVIVSGFSESDRVQAAQSLGAGPYVRKPYVKEKLGLAVRKELDRAALSNWPSPSCLIVTP
jgi:PAS domain S-box-containing protein